MGNRLENKVALITGGAAGFGKGTAAVLAREGATVYISDINKEGGEKVAKELGIKFFEHDVTDPDRWQEIIEEIKTEQKQLNVLVNNAGVTKDNLLMRMGEEDFDKVIEVNLKSVFNMTKAVQRTMLKQRKGSIINMSSVVGVKGNAGQSNYAASKAGIIGFSKSVALELGSRNIRSNVIAPGFIETEMTAKLDEKTVDVWRNAIPLKRGGSPEDIANACVFLASDLSAYVTGQTLNVDGGMLT